MKNYRRRRPSSGGGNASFWLSFLDLMSVLVLIFIFVIFSMMYTLKEAQDNYIQAHNEYEIALAELEAKNEENANLLVLVSDYETQLNDTQDALDEANKQLIVITGEKANLQTELDEQKTLVVSLKAQAESDKGELIRLRDYNKQLSDENTQLAGTNASLKRENADLITQQQKDKNELSLYQQRLSDAQTQLEALLGVKAEIIQELSNELRRNGIEVTVDTQTGAIVLPSSMMFNSGKAVLSRDGERFLDNFLPVYLNVLLSDRFEGYVAEIVIEGHTDSTPRGGFADAYLGNLGLSLERAEAVANYVLDPDYMRTELHLSQTQVNRFKKLVTTSGRSFSDLKTNPDGSENAEQSRRVEIKFRLVDADSVYATQQIIRQE